MKLSQHPAIVLGGGSANGLGITRNLGSLGIPVYCLTSNRHDLMRYSKYCTQSTVVPYIEQDVETLRRVLQQLQPHLPGTGVLFPTTDTALLTVSHLQDELEGYVTPLPERGLIETMVIKSQFYTSLRQWKVPHPRTWYPDHESWPEIVDQLTYPLFLRPTQSLPFVTDFKTKGFIAQTLLETKTYFNRAKQAGHSILLQEIIPGPPTTEFAIRGFMDRQSRLIMMVPIQRIRSFAMFRPRPVMKSIPLTPIAEFAARILQYLQNIHYSGLFIAEFKQDPRDGQFKLFEINARSGGDNDFLRACGANHIFAAYREALGESVHPTSYYKTEVYNINLLLDLALNAQRFLRGQPLTNSLRPYLSAKQWHSFSTDDPLPFLADIYTKLI